MKVKTLACGNLMNLRTIHALASVTELEIFAELPVQGLVDCMWNVVSPAIFMEQVTELVSLLVLAVWSFLPPNSPWRWMCWSLTCSWVMRDIFNQVWYCWCVVLLSWKKLQLVFMTMKGLANVVLSALGLLLVLLTLDTFSIDGVDEASCFASGLSAAASNVRPLLAWTIMFKFVKVTMLLRCEASFGPRVLCILLSFPPVFIMFVLTLWCFLAFCTAFTVVQGQASREAGFTALLLAMHKGLILGDAGSLAEHEETPLILVFATLFFSLCIMNLITSVFSNEYDKAAKEVELVFWRERANMCRDMLLRPTWTFHVTSITGKGSFRLDYHLLHYVRDRVKGTRLKQILLLKFTVIHWLVQTLGRFLLCVNYGSARLVFLLRYVRVRRFAFLQWLGIVRRSRQPLSLAQLDKAFYDSVGVGRDTEETVREAIHWVGEWCLDCMLVLAAYQLMATSLFVDSEVKSGFWTLMPAALFSFAFIMHSALLLENDSLVQSQDKPRFLWICHYSDFDPNDYICKDVEKEHIDQLQERLDAIEDRMVTLEQKADTKVTVLLPDGEGLKLYVSSLQTVEHLKSMIRRNVEKFQNAQLHILSERTEKILPESEIVARCDIRRFKLRVGEAAAASPCQRASLEQPAPTMEDRLCRIEDMLLRMTERQRSPQKQGGHVS